MNRDLKNKRERMMKKVPMRARLSFDEGFAEKPIYTIKALVNEKLKGIRMIDLIKQNFNISDMEHKNNFKKEVERLNGDKEERQKKDAFTRDKDGRIISPFASNMKTR